MSNDNDDLYSDDDAVTLAAGGGLFGQQPAATTAAPAGRNSRSVISVSFPSCQPSFSLLTHPHPLMIAAAGGFGGFGSFGQPAAGAAAPGKISS